MSEPRLTGDAFFEYWKKLSEEDPGRYELERAMAIGAVLSRMSEHRRKRLLLLQLRLDALREDVDDPLSATVLMSWLMWQSICGEGYGMLHLLHALEGRFLVVLKARYELLLAIKEGSAPA